MGEKNITEKEVKKLIKNFGFEPSSYRLIVTINRTLDDNGVIATENALADVQFVVAAGTNALYKSGEKILLDLASMTVKERVSVDSTETIDRLRINPFAYDGVLYTMITDREVLGKFTKPLPVQKKSKVTKVGAE